MLAPLIVGYLPRLRLPSVVLEIVAGVILGPSVLGWVQVDLPVQVLSVLGLAFLLFLAGLEIDLGAAWSFPADRRSGLRAYAGAWRGCRWRARGCGLDKVAAARCDGPVRDVPRAGGVGTQGAGQANAPSSRPP